MHHELSEVGLHRVSVPALPSFAGGLLHGIVSLFVHSEWTPGLFAFWGYLE